MPPETIDSLDKDRHSPLVRELLARVGELLATTQAQGARIDELLAEIKRLLARIAELEAKLGAPPKTPANSSLPPSSGRKANTDPPSQKKPRAKGHPGVTRELCPSPDVTRDLKPERCTCGTSLAAAGQVLAHAYDHVELPPIKPVTTRINLWRADCPCCRARVTAEAPADMPPGSPFGSGIVSIVAYLHGCHMVSYSRLVEVLDALLGVELSEGAIANMLARAEKPFAAEADKIAEIVRQSPVIASDETSARVCGKTWWQWLFASASAVYHTIVPTRGKCVPVDFLASIKPEVWVSDRLAAQGTHAEAHQYCCAHLIRDAQFAVDAGDTVFAPAFKAFLQRACAIGKRRPGLTDATMARHRRDLERELDRLLALPATNAEGRHLQAAMIVDARDKLLVFMTRRDVPPTNNVSEQGLRMSVIFRKVTNGFRSCWGAKVYADLCSIVATGRLHGRSPLAAIREALAASRRPAAA